MEVDKDVNVENSEGPNLHDGDMRACPIVRLKSPTTVLVTVWSQTLAKATLKKMLCPAISGA
jgi:hypothetical protein